MHCVNLFCVIMDQCKDRAFLLLIVCIGLLSLVDSSHHRKERSRTGRSHFGGSNRINLIEEEEEEFTSTLAPGEIFLSDNCTKILAQTGTTPILHCEVGDIGESTVSWIRREDYHLLTVGLLTYSSDERFFTSHVRSPQDWALHIRFAEKEDDGLYECQVSTHPPTSLFVHLQLIEARAEIQGAPDKFVKSGSSLKLICRLLQSTEPPSFVFWYHEKRMINYDKERGVRVDLSRYSSELFIEKAHKTDSGNYTCAPSNAQAASITVHILNSTQEEKPAAMQHGSKSASPRFNSYVQLTLVFVFFICLRNNLFIQER